MLRRIRLVRLIPGIVLLLGSVSCGAWDRSQRIYIRGTPLAKYNACREIHRNSPEDIEKLCTPYLDEG